MFRIHLGNHSNRPSHLGIAHLPEGVMENTVTFIDATSRQDDDASLPTISFLISSISRVFFFPCFIRFLATPPWLGAQINAVMISVNTVPEIGC